MDVIAAFLTDEEHTAIEMCSESDAQSLDDSDDRQGGGAQLDVEESEEHQESEENESGADSINKPDEQDEEAASCMCIPSSEEGEPADTPKVLL